MLARLDEWSSEMTQIRLLEEQPLCAKVLHWECMNKCACTAFSLATGKLSSFSFGVLDTRGFITTTLVSIVLYVHTTHRLKSFGLPCSASYICFGNIHGCYNVIIFLLN